MKHRPGFCWLAVWLSASACGPGGASPPARCGLADPASGEVVVCGDSSYCACAAGECAVAWTACSTGYRFAADGSPCLSPAQVATLVPSTPADHPECPLAADADADGDGGGDGDGDGDGDADGGPPEADDGDEEPPDGPHTFEMSIFSREELYASPTDRRQVARDVIFPVPQPYSRILLEYRLRTGCPSLCESTSRATDVTLDLEDGTVVELFRAMTPFGGNRVWVEDVTDLAGWLVSGRRVTLAVDTVEGAWEADLRLLFTTGPAPRDVLAVFPIVFEREVAAGTDVPERRVLVPAGVSSATFLYRASGHARAGAGCDEACPRHSIVSIDGVDRLDHVPWRTDCADFVDANPGADPVAVSASRAGWCPADLVHAAALDAAAWLSPGFRTVDLRIADVTPDAGYWRAGLILVLYR